MFDFDDPTYVTTCRVCGFTVHSDKPINPKECKGCGLKVIKMEHLKVTLLTIGVVSALSDEDLDYAIDHDIEFFVAPKDDSEIQYRLKGDFNGMYTNQYWKLVPQLEVECDQDEKRVWQQMIWAFEGEFEISRGMTPIEAIRSISWELTIQSKVAGVELEEFHWRVLEVVKIAK